MNFERLKATLIRHEGLRLKPYRCTAGKLTIGVGRNLDDNGINYDEAIHLLGNDIRRVSNELRRRYKELTGRTFETLDDVRQEALINMAFNLGMPRLLQFKNMWGALIAGDYSRAADEMLNSHWAEQVGQRAYELSMMMRTGVPQE